MQLTADKMQAATGCTRGTALTWAPYLAAACQAYGITTPARLAAFLAQVGHESAGFTATVENLNYSAAALLRTWPSRFDADTAAQLARKPQLIAERVYGGRLGNKDAGDGWRFRGRGLLQVTGRANYEAVRDLLRKRAPDTPDLLKFPEALAEPKWAAMSAAAWWNDHDLNDLADAAAFDAITRRVNGGQTGAADRRARYQKARAALA